MPVPEGAVQETVAWALPEAAVTAVGAAGRVWGTIDAEAADVGPVPLAFTSLTLTVYEVPVVRPVIVQLAVVPAVTWVLSVQVFEPDDDVAVWVVMAEPPLFGTVQETVIDAVPALAASGLT